MTLQDAVHIVSQDRSLIAALDETLRRRDIQAEWHHFLSEEVLHPERHTKRLLIVDLNLKELSDAPFDVNKFITPGSHLLLIPGDTAPPSNLPAGVELLSSRSTKELIETARRLLGLSERIFQRRHFEADVEIKPQDEESFIAHSSDLSSGGVHVESRQRLSQGERITMRFMNPKGRTDLSCEGCVAWQKTSQHGSQTNYDAGIQFLFPDREKLDRLLASPLH